MKIRVPKYYDKFKCIADKCEDTCCAGWGIVIDKDTYEKYKNITGEFGEVLKSKIKDEDGEKVFVLKGNDCPFLNNNLCDIYKELGEEGLCYTCRQYPRFTEEFGTLREVGISLSCPEAARVILSETCKTEFSISENDEEITSYNDINAMLFIELMQCRSILMNITQNRLKDLNERAAVALKFISEVQEKIDENLINEIKDVRSKYLDEKYIQSIYLSIQSYKGKEEEKYNNIYEYFIEFKNLKHINPNDPLGLENAFQYFWNSKEDIDIYLAKHREFNEFYKDNTYKFENILVYFIYRYFMKAVFDYDVLAKIKTAIISYIMIKELCVLRWIENKNFTEEDMVDISHTYSKDIEHLEENIEKLAEVFEINNSFKVEDIVKVLMN